MTVEDDCGHAAQKLATCLQEFVMASMSRASSTSQWPQFLTDRVRKEIRETTHPSHQGLVLSLFEKIDQAIQTTLHEPTRLHSDRAGTSPEDDDLGEYMLQADQRSAGLRPAVCNARRSESESGCQEDMATNAEEEAEEENDEKEKTVGATGYGTDKETDEETEEEAEDVTEDGTGDQPEEPIDTEIEGEVRPEREIGTEDETDKEVEQESGQDAMRKSRREAEQNREADSWSSMGTPLTTARGFTRTARTTESGFHHVEVNDHQKRGLSPDFSNTTERFQINKPIIASRSAKADLRAIPPPQLSKSNIGENRARLAAPPDQIRTAPTTIPFGAEISDLEKNNPNDAVISRRSRRVALTQSQPQNSAHSVSETPDNIDIGMPYREEHGVVILMPLNMGQCRDMPFLLSQAEALGARETGVFKYVLPDDFGLGTQAVFGGNKRVSRFTSHHRPDNSFHISRTEHTETLHIGHTSLTPIEPDELAEMLERCLTDPEAMSKMQYCTDVPARTAKDRERLGLPAESPIWPLRGNLLERTRYSIPGLHWPYGYLSGHDGSLFTIHVEDGRLPSVNALYRGAVKLWNAVAPKDGYLIRNEVEGGECAQKVRHASLWIPRSKLKAMGASFVTFVQRPGEVVVVWGDTYHQGGTVGHGIAEAVNYGDPNWSIEGYAECSPNCDGFPIPNRLLEFRALDDRQREQEDRFTPEARNSAQSGGRQPVARPVRVGQPVNMKPQEGKRLRKRSRAVIRTVTENESDVRGARISQMVATICSREAIKQFFDIVRGRRDLEPTALRVLARNHDPIQLLKNDVQIIDQFSRKTSFHRFLTRLYQVRLAQHAEGLKRSRDRISKGGIEKILQGTGMNERQYYYHRDRGTRWQGYDKAFPGILGFILFNPQAFNFSSADWLLLKDTDFDSLLRRLDRKYVSVLCSAGKLFEGSLNPAADDVDFICESQNLDKVSEADLASCLKPFPFTDENIYAQTAYPAWPEPDGWPTDFGWPVDPTSLPPSAKPQCSLCSRSKCDCASFRHEIQPRIRIYEDKGRGLQAVAREAGHVAYKKGAIINYITGRLAPPNTYRNGKCIAIFRSDLDLEPEVAQMNCNETGNIYRLMNHDCKPSAKLEGMRVSGKFRMAVIAIKDIRDGEEITIDYGPGYWGKEKCPCPICQSRAITTLT